MAEAQEPCTVRDPVSGAIYDLSPLSSSTSNWVASDSRDGNRYEYQLNVCRSLVRVPGQPDCFGAAACQVARTSNTTHENKLGMADSPQIQNGQLFIEYVGGDVCSSGKPRRTRIDFFCSTDDQSTGEPVFLTETDDCAFIFVWNTNAACANGQGLPPAPSRNDCTAEDPRTHVVYDLSALRNTVFTTAGGDARDSRNYTYTLSVCGPLTGADTCGNATTAGACQISTTGTRRDLGVATASLATQRGVVTMRYNSGSLCRAGLPTQSSRDTLVVFECDMNAGNGMLEFVDETDDCTYVFRLRTKWVCSAELPDEPCQIDTPNGLVNLGVLSKWANWVAVSNEYSYYINVCASLQPMPGLPMCNGSSACQAKPSDGRFGKSLGTLISPPMLAEDGDITLTYEVQGNDLCHRQFHRKVLLRVREGGKNWLE